MSAEQSTGATTDHEQVVDRLVQRFDHHDPQLGIDVVNDVYRGLLQGPPVQRTEAHGGFTYLTRYADIVEISKNPGIYSSAKNGVRHPSQANGPRSIPAETDRPLHSEYRKLFLNVLSPPRVRDAEPFLRKLTEDLVRDYVAGPQEDFAQEVAVQLPIRAVGSLVGWDLRSSEAMQRHVETMQHNYGKPEALEALNALGAIAQLEIDERRARPRGDYLTTLVHAEVGGKLLTDDELQNILRSFIFAGFETTAHMIGSMMVYLAEQPELQQRIREDGTALANFVEEATRLFLPVHTMFRTVVKPTRLRDTELQPGEVVGLLYGAANRDPEKFENPEQFNLDRPNVRQHLSFGFGAHLCAGSQLARTEMIMLLQVLREYPPFTLGGPVKYPPHLLGGQMLGPELIPISIKTTERHN